MKIFNTFRDKETLIEAGLEEKEALIYLAALETGGGTVSELASIINIERTGIYYYIERLIELHLLKPVARGKRRVFIPADPSVIKKMVEERKRHFDRSFQRLEELFSRQTSRSIVEYFQGKDELNVFYDRVYSLLSEMKPPENTIYVLGTAFSVVTQGKELLKFTPPTEQLAIITRAILPISQKSKEPDGNKGDPYIITRYSLPAADLKFISDKYSYPGAINIMGDFVVSYDYRNMIYSITENKNMAATWRMFFAYIWDSLPRTK